MPETLTRNESNPFPVVLVDGATGYLGSHVAFYLAKRGYPVRCLVREKADRLDVEQLSRLGVEVVKADLSAGSLELEKAFEGVQVGVHLIGSIAPARGESLNDLHVQQSQFFAAQCLRAGVSKVIMVTTLGAAENAPSLYHSTKWLAEEVLRKSGLPTIFLRPSLIVGKLAGRRDSKLVKRYRDMIKTKRFVPLLGGGSNKLQPIFIGDLLEVIRLSIDSTALAQGQEAAPAFELGGPQAISMRQFVSALMQSLDLAKPVIDLPFPIASLAAGLSEMLQDVPVLSRDQLVISKTDNVCQNNAAVSVFNLNTTDLKTALKSYEAEGKDLTLSGLRN
jgi:NADH dehydrogenase